MQVSTVEIEFTNDEKARARTFSTATAIGCHKVLAGRTIDAVSGLMHA